MKRDWDLIRKQLTDIEEETICSLRFPPNPSGRIKNGTFLKKSKMTNGLLKLESLGISNCLLILGT